MTTKLEQPLHSSVPFFVTSLIMQTTLVLMEKSEPKVGLEADLEAECERVPELDLLSKNNNINLPNRIRLYFHLENKCTDAFRGMKYGYTMFTDSSDMEWTIVSFQTRDDAVKAFKNLEMVLGSGHCKLDEK